MSKSKQQRIEEVKEELRVEITDLSWAVEENPNNLYYLINKDLLEALYTTFQKILDDKKLSGLLTHEHLDWLENKLK